MVDVSIVVPVYYNEKVVSTTFRALQANVISAFDDVTFEIIFVDDGSGDRSLDELLEIREQYPALVRVIKVTRNFGQTGAILAGLAHFQGKCAIVMSADNQDPANLIHEMLGNFWDEEYDIVIAKRTSREESWFRIVSSRIFYYLMRRLSFSNMPEGGFDYVLLSRRVVATMLNNQEATPFFQGQILWTGYRAKFIEYRRRKREIGKSRWTTGMKLTYFVDGIIGYSFLPIRLLSSLGFVVAILGFLYALVIIVSRLVWGLPIQGWAPIMVTILIIGGIQMMMLGIIGEYLWRVLAQVRSRDLYVIDRIFEQADTPAEI